MFQYIHKHHLFASFALYSLKNICTNLQKYIRFDAKQKHFEANICFRSNICFTFSHTGEYSLQNICFEANNCKRSSQCCRSGMFIPDSRSWFLSIPDLESKNSNKREGWKQICCPFFVATRIIKLKVILILNWRKNNWASLLRIIELFTPKIANKLSKIWVWNPVSGKNLFRIMNLGVKKAQGSGSTTLGQANFTFKQIFACKYAYKWIFQGFGSGSVSGSGSALIWVAGSGSGSAFKLRIRIRIQEGKNDQQK